MNIPGSNILNMALRVIASSGVQYYQFVSNSINDRGLTISVYADPIVIYGSFQPIDRKLYVELGLDLSRDYADLFVPNNVLDLNRGVTGDGILFESQTYKCEASAPWYGIDGWTKILLVRVPSLQGS